MKYFLFSATICLFYFSGCVDQDEIVRQKTRKEYLNLVEYGEQTGEFKVSEPLKMNDSLLKKKIRNYFSNVIKKDSVVCRVEDEFKIKPSDEDYLYFKKMTVAWCISDLNAIVVTHNDTFKGQRKATLLLNIVREKDEIAIFLRRAYFPALNEEYDKDAEEFRYKYDIEQAEERTRLYLKDLVAYLKK